MAETLATATEKPLTILAIEDDAGDAEIIRRHLEQIPDFHFHYLHRTDSESGRTALSQQQVGVVLLDYRLGAETGLEALTSFRSDGYLGPVIIVTGQGDEYVSANLIRSGADDYVAKKDLAPDILQRAIHNAMAQQSRREVETHNQRLLAELQTTKRALEEKNRRLAELYETAHQFVDNVSHEFRTPLTVIKEFTAIIRDGLAGEISDEQREYLEIVLNRVDDLSTMVDDVLDWFILRKKDVRKLVEFTAKWEAMILDHCDHFTVTSTFWTGLKFKTLLLLELPDRQGFQLKGEQFVSS